MGEKRFFFLYVAPFKYFSFHAVLCQLAFQGKGSSPHRLGIQIHTAVQDYITNVNATTMSFSWSSMICQKLLNSDQGSPHWPARAAKRTAGFKLGLQTHNL